MKASCEVTLGAYDTAFLTGFTGRVASALAHLRDAWCNADPTNRPQVAVAIAALFCTRSVEARRRAYLPFVRHGLDLDLADELENQLESAVAYLDAHVDFDDATTWRHE